MLRRYRLLALLLLGCTLACGGGGGGHTPTEPPLTSKRLDIVFTLSVVSLDGGAATEGAVFLDGREISRTNWVRERGSACSLILPCQLTLRADGVSEGNHTVEVMIVTQNRGAITYVIGANGSVTTSSTGAVRNFTLPVQDVTLRAGDKVPYSVSV